MLNTTVRQCVCVFTNSIVEKDEKKIFEIKRRLNHIFILISVYLKNYDVTNRNDQ